MLRIKIDKQQEEGIKIRYAFGKMYEVSVPQSYMEDKKKIDCVDCWVRVYNDYIYKIIKYDCQNCDREMYLHYCSEASALIMLEEVDAIQMINLAKPNKQVQQILKDIVKYIYPKIGKEVVE